MTVIDITRRLELTDLVRDLRIAARTIRSETMLERRETCVAFVGELREGWSRLPSSTRKGSKRSTSGPSASSRLTRTTPTSSRSSSTDATRSCAFISGGRPGCRSSLPRRAARPTSSSRALVRVELVERRLRARAYPRQVNGVRTQPCSTTSHFRWDLLARGVQAVGKEPQKTSGR